MKKTSIIILSSIIIGALIMGRKVFTNREQIQPFITQSVNQGKAKYISMDEGESSYIVGPTDPTDPCLEKCDITASLHINDLLGNGETLGYCSINDTCKGTYTVPLSYSSVLTLDNTTENILAAADNGTKFRIDEIKLYGYNLPSIGNEISNVIILNQCNSLFESGNHDNYKSCVFNELKQKINQTFNVQFGIDYKFHLSIRPFKINFVNNNIDADKVWVGIHKNDGFVKIRNSNTAQIIVNTPEVKAISVYNDNGLLINNKEKNIAGCEIIHNGQQKSFDFTFPGVYDLVDLSNTNYNTVSLINPEQLQIESLNYQYCNKYMCVSAGICTSDFQCGNGGICEKGYGEKKCKKKYNVYCDGNQIGHGVGFPEGSCQTYQDCPKNYSTTFENLPYCEEKQIDYYYECEGIPLEQGLCNCENVIPECGNGICETSIGEHTSGSGCCSLDCNIVCPIIKNTNNEAY